jgi:hypothetical protein
MISCIPLNVNRHFGGTCEQQAGFEVNLAVDMKYFILCIIHAGFLLGLLLNPKDGGYVFLRNAG